MVDRYYSAIRAFNGTNESEIPSGAVFAKDGSADQDPAPPLLDACVRNRHGRPRANASGA